MVLYPFWHVPYKIAWKEILPHVKKDTNYLNKHKYEVFDRKGAIINPSTVEWSRYGENNLPYKFRQKIGSGNSLGILKFNFQNKYGVYMHDTNSKSFFGRETRAYSHGCMRLEKYMDLAYYLIKEDSLKLPKDTFNVYMKAGRQRTYNLSHPIPIYVRYFTCVLSEDGSIVLLTDIYGLDRKMARLFYPSAK
jgi:murein L,D-transpeptidase YcbB/YkuD